MARNMINSTNIAEQIVEPDENVLFVVDKIKSCGCNGCNYIVHEAGSGQFLLRGQGIYRVLFSTNLTSAEAGNAIIDIESNGENVNEAKIEIPIVVDTFIRETTFADIIVPCGTSKTITIGNNSIIPINFKNTNIEIKRIG